MRAASSPTKVPRWLRAAAPRSAHLQGSESSGEVCIRTNWWSAKVCDGRFGDISPVSHRQFASPAGGRACGTPSPMGGLVFRPRLIRRCARVRAISTAYVRKFSWKSLQKKMPWPVLPAPSGPRAKKKAQTTAPARGGGRGMSVGARGVLQIALMGLITALRQRNRPKWTSRAVSRGGFFETTQTETTGF